MRDLTLVLKAYLNSQRLNDVATGGLSSYSLCNMIVAHLQEELKVGEWEREGMAWLRSILGLLRLLSHLPRYAPSPAHVWHMTDRPESDSFESPPCLHNTGLPSVCLSLSLSSGWPGHL